MSTREERLKEKRKAAAKRKKENRAKRKADPNANLPSYMTAVKKEKVAPDAGEKIEVEYVSEDLTVPEGFEDVFKNFMPVESLLAERTVEEEPAGGASVAEVKAEGNEPANKKKWKSEPAAAAAPSLSKKQRKEEKRLRVARLKQMVAHPEVVDMHDVSSPDPLLLIQLRTHKNAVSIPRHWKQKRKYLQAKRGADKIPFQLPEYIAATGVATMRAAQLEKDSEKNSKQKNREKMLGKGGKLDIDYRVLHDAFFKHQTKPKLTDFGDMYYENKEFEVDVKTKRPGYLSSTLRHALGMPEGAPPPWLLNMQRMGPPPSYPNLRIPGLNAPLPPGCEYGYHAGGWGKPPVDQWDRPLYGDVYGTLEEDPTLHGLMEPPTTDTTTRWGAVRRELEVEVDDDDDDELNEMEESGEAEEEAAGDDEEEAPGIPSALEESKETLELRKKAASVVDKMGRSQAHELPVQGAVLAQKQTAVGDGLYGSSFKYVIPSADEKSGAVIKSQRTGEEVITLDEADLQDMEGDNAAELLRKKFQAVIEAKEGGKLGGGAGRDMDEIHAEQSRKKSKKKKAKKDDDFKFG